MKVKVSVLMALMLALLPSCVSHERAKQMFVESRDFDVGRIVTQVPVRPDKIVPIGEGASLYIYKFKKTGCQWSYEVDNATKRIVTWRFISDPDVCYLRLGAE